METSRGSGPGGQHRNVHDTAVTITHLPTGTVVYNCETRSQSENRERALAELQRRLDRRAETEAARKTNDKRKTQVVPERSAKSFTWNTQRGTVVDHDTGKTWRLKDFARGRI